MVWEKTVEESLENTAEFIQRHNALKMNKNKKTLKQ
jgi:hypothetical protein